MSLPTATAWRSPGRTMTLLLALLLATLAGCGFHLRGQGPALAGLPSPLAVTGLSPFAPLMRELREQLKLATVTVVDEPAQAAATLALSGARSDTRLLSVNSRNKAVEYVLEQSVDFTLLGADGTPILPRQTVEIRRIQYRPEGAILGSDNETELLREEMNRELVAQLLRRMAAR